MKRLFATITCLVALTFAAVPVSAQQRARVYNKTVQQRNYDQRVNSRYNDRAYGDSRSARVYDDRYYDYEDRSRWEKSRDKITTAGGAVGGAVLGGLIGGKKGAIIGAITGGGAAALYTYKIRDKNRRY